MPDNSPPPLEYQVYDPERQEIDVVAVPPLRTRYWLHILLFLATLLSTLSIGARLQYDFDRNAWPFAGDEHSLFWTWALVDPRRLVLGIPFALSLLAILTAHEFGHYIVCRRRNVLATLPFFIPFPSLFGTLGAVIRIRSPIASRKDLFDIGIAGPIAGFVVALPILVVSLLNSKLLTIQAGDSWPVLGFPLIFDLARRALAALGSHAPAAHVQAALYLAPSGIAAWVGMLATSLNLLPGGQLDGGHIIFALSPRHHRLVSSLSGLALIVLSWFFWTGWLLWAIVLRVTTSRHPMVPMHPGLPLKSRILALLAAVMLAVTLIPVPVAGAALPQAIDAMRQAYHEYRHPSK
jgi:membrane-associated protease RseP (regulator of RpoE activity)